MHLQLLPQFVLALEGSKDGLGLDEFGVGRGNTLLLHLLESLQRVLENTGTRERGYNRLIEMDVRRKGGTDHEDFLRLLLGHARRDGGAWVLHRRRHLDAGHGGGSDID